MDVDGINWADADCHYGDHHWDGGVCSNCGKQLRCGCGQFVTVEGIDKHLEESCPQTRGLVMTDA